MVDKVLSQALSFICLKTKEGLGTERERDRERIFLVEKMNLPDGQLSDRVS